MANPTPPSATALTPNLSTLTAIETKVRRLTRNPSVAQLSQADLDNYINTFVLYDFPEHLRTFNFKSDFSFYCNRGQDVYNTDIASYAGATNNLLYNFQNLYLTVHPPFYVAGFQSFFTQSPNQLYNIYPKINNIASIGVRGDGVTTQFQGVINSQQAIIPPNNFQQTIGLLQNEVLFSSVDTAGIGLALVDVPVVDALTGYKSRVGNLYDPNSAAYQAALQTPPTVPFVAPFAPGTGVMNYLGGQFIINFAFAPAANAPINSQTVPSSLSMPQAVMFYANKFYLRPVPDQPYQINFEVYSRPTALLGANQYPELEEYWQYIAYGAAKKIFEDKMDLDSVQMIMPEFKKQEALCLRRSLVQLANQRTSTIYTEQASMSSGFNGWGYGGGNF